MKRFECLGLAGVLGTVLACTQAATQPASTRFAFDDFLLAPLRVHLLSASNAPTPSAGAFHTTLTQHDITRILTKINNVWSQAGVTFYLEALVREEATGPPPNSASLTFQDRDQFLKLRPEDTRSERTFHVYYIKTMAHNGVYFPEGIFVKDTASLKKVEGGIDEPLPRVTSHELGHALKLSHRQNNTNLMASGTTGTWLNEEEIKQAREAARKLEWVEAAPVVLERADALYRAQKRDEAVRLYQWLAAIPIQADQVRLAQARLTAAESPTRKPQSTIHNPDGSLLPEAALGAFRLLPGLRVELVAAEPTVADPVALCFDESGRMYVAEDRGYPTGPGEGKPPAGIIALLEDKDGDGRYESRTVFAEGLIFPNGVMPWKGGVFVTCAPDVLYLKDNDGDGRADVRRVVLTGFDAKNTTQLRVSHPTLGIDNWVYLTSGFTGASKVTAPDHPERAPVELRTDSRFQPDTGEFEATDGRAQFGLTFDDFGRRFICMNRVHIQHVVLPSRYLGRNPHLAFAETVQNVPEAMVPEPLRGHGTAARIYPISRNITTADSHAGTFTAACGVHIYRGTALPEEYHGCAFACDPTGNLVHCDKLTPVGATFSARAIRDGVEFLASTDDWFRPVFLADGPDGALYICDMYRKTIEHPQYLPEEVRKRTDFDSGKGMGRIYRVTAERHGTESKMKKVNLARARTKDLCEQLSHPNAWQREAAQRLLIERQDKTAIPLLESAIRHAPSGPAVARVHALRTLAGLGDLDDEAISSALADGNPGVREHGVQLAEPRLIQSPKLLSYVVALVDDPDARVRFQCALTLGEASDPRVISPLTRIALRDCNDRWARAAVLSSVARRELLFLDELISQSTAAAQANKDELPALMSELGRVLGSGQSQAQLAQALEALAGQSREGDFVWQIPALAGFAEGLRSRGIKSGEDSPFAGLTLPDSGAPGTTSQRIALLMERSRALAADATRTLSLRQAAVALLGQAEFGKVGGALLDLLSPRQPIALQSAAVRSLAQIADPAAGAALLERWLSYTPPVREVVLASFLSQPRYLPALLTALENGDVPLGALDSARRKQLAQHRDEAIRQRAEALFKKLAPADRMKVYEEYKPVLSFKSDPKNGRAVFKLHCAACHRLDRDGVPVGPDLFSIRNQSKETILLHIIVPEYEIVPGFGAYEVETRDGRTLSGIIASETAASVTLRGAQNQEETVLRSNIASMTSTGLSLMPQELEKNMSRQDLADLISYLKGEGE